MYRHRVLDSPVSTLPLVIAAAIALNAVMAFAQDAVSGDAVLKAPVGDSEIVITTTSRLAGAIHSLTWNQREFVDSADHGRQLQSASNLNSGLRMMPETFNPTEAGSRHDGAGPQSTSRLLHLIASENRLQTTTQMAFWLRPGETSGGHPAVNTTVLSNHLLTKRVVIGFRDLPHVLQYDVTFSLPVDEQHRYAQFEALTGYMPPEFSQFLAFNAESGQLEPITDGPGEQPHPVVLATADGQYAMGCIALSRPPEIAGQPPVNGAGWSGPGYGRWRFTAQKVVKWNCVFRYRDPEGVPSGDYSFRMLVPIGTVETVRRTLVSLHNLPPRELPVPHRN